MPAARIKCCIPSCNRSLRNDLGFTEWVCGPHWRLVPKVMRRIYARAKRRHRATQAINRIWARCRDEAVAQNFMVMT